MKAAKGVLFLIALVLIVLGFLSWRMDFRVFGTHYLFFIILGIILSVSLYYGRLIGRVLLIGSLFPLGYALFYFLFNKDITWNDVSQAVIYGSIALGSGVVLYAIGSQTVEKDYDDRQAHGRRSIVCAQCDQYLGIADSFESPCPRCGSNRYTNG